MRRHLLKVFSPIFLTVLTVSYAVFVCHRSLLSGQVTFSHDVLCILTVFQIFYSSLFQGILPLWNPYMNAGMPLWPSLETMAVGDPVALVVYFLTYAMGGNGVVAYAWCNFMWLMSFCVGASLLGNKIKDSAYWFPLLVIIFLCGSTFAGAGAQAGFIMPFRYLPFILYQWIIFTEKKNLKEALLLGAAIGVNGCGYQNSYFLVPFVLFILFHSIFNARRIAQSYAKMLPLLLVSLTVVIIFWFPSVLAFLKYKDYVVLTREIMGHSYFYTIKEGLRNLLWPFYPIDAWHGSLFMTTPLMLAFIWGVLTLRKKHADRAILLLVAVGMGLILFGENQFHGILLGNEGKLLGLRNWGYCLTVFLLFITLFAFASVKKRWLEIGVILLALGETHWVMHNQGLFVPVSSATSKIANSFGIKKAKWQAKRNWMLEDESMNAPFAFEGPTLLKESVAYLPVFPPNEIAFKGTTPITSFFRTPEYQVLLAKKLPASIYLCLLGQKKNVLDVLPKVNATVLDYCGANSSETQFAYSVDTYNENKLEISVKTIQPIPLIYKSFLDDDWVVKVNGIPTSYSKQWDAFPVIPLPAGNSSVSFHYEPELYITAFCIRTFFTCLLMIFCALAVFSELFDPAFFHVAVAKR